MLKRFTQALDRLIYRMANTTLRGVFSKAPTREDTQPVPEVERPQHLAGWLTLIAYSWDSPGLRQLGWLMARATTIDTFAVEGVASTRKWGQETTKVYVSKVYPTPRLLREALDKLNEICALVVSPEGLVYCSQRPGEIIGRAAFHDQEPNGDHTLIVGQGYLSVHDFKPPPVLERLKARAPLAALASVASTVVGARHGAPVMLDPARHQPMPERDRQDTLKQQAQVQHQHQVPQGSLDTDPMGDGSPYNGSVTPGSPLWDGATEHDNDASLYAADVKRARYQVILEAENLLDGLNDDNIILGVSRLPPLKAALNTYREAQHTAAQHTKSTDDPVRTVRTTRKNQEATAHEQALKENIVHVACRLVATRYGWTDQRGLNTLWDAVEALQGKAATGTLPPTKPT